MTSVLEEIGNTPLVPLRHLTRGLPNPVWVKCEHLNPGGSVKDRIALSIVNHAERTGKLVRGATLVEATAGNTGIGLALVAAARGYGLVCTMPEKMAEEKRRALRTLGADLVVTENAPLDDPRNFQNIARELARDRGYFATDQFGHPANIAAHEHGTAPEIWRALGCDPAAFVAGAGTGGTITGVARFARTRGSRTQIVLADPVGSGLADWIETGTPGPDGYYDVEGIGSAQPTALMQRDLIDAAERVTDEESFTTTRRLIREEGLLVGGSSGTAVAAALRVAANPETHGPVVALLPDSWDRYFSCSWMRT